MGIRRFSLHSTNPCILDFWNYIQSYMLDSNPTEEHWKLIQRFRCKMSEGNKYGRKVNTYTIRNAGTNLDDTHRVHDTAYSLYPQFPQPAVHGYMSLSTISEASVLGSHDAGDLYYQRAQARRCFRAAHKLSDREAAIEAFNNKKSKAHVLVTFTRLSTTSYNLHHNSPTSSSLMSPPAPLTSSRLAVEFFA